jgi:hypothetical protein
METSGGARSNETRLSTQSKFVFAPKRDHDLPVQFLSSRNDTNFAANFTGKVTSARGTHSYHHSITNHTQASNHLASKDRVIVSRGSNLTIPVGGLHSRVSFCVRDEIVLSGGFF